MKKLVATAVLTSALLMLSACGDDGKGPGNQAAYQGNLGGGDGNECSDLFVNDYNSVKVDVRQVQSDANVPDSPQAHETIKIDAQAAIASANAFKAKYAGVSCVANVNGSRQTVNASSDMDSIVSVMNQVITTLNSIGSARAETRVATPRSLLDSAITAEIKRL